MEGEGVDARRGSGCKAREWMQGEGMDARRGS